MQGCDLVYEEKAVPIVLAQFGQYFKLVGILSAADQYKLEGVFEEFTTIFALFEA